MKTLKYLFIIGFAAQLLNAQSSLVVETGASLDIGLGADVCATAYGNIKGALTGDWT